MRETHEKDDIVSAIKDREVGRLSRPLLMLRLFMQFSVAGIAPYRNMTDGVSFHLDSRLMKTTGNGCVSLL